MSFKKIAASLLAISEPDPRWFGNSPNDVRSVEWTNSNWLKSRFHFSFAEYWNSQNKNFGVLRVLNDDLVQPERGFGAHGHKDVEICTYIVQGHLTHKDSMGTAETLTRGAVQFMTAGTGVRHSEHNLHPTEPLRFIQMWLTPRTDDLAPNYGSAPGDPAARLNQWHHIVADVQQNQGKDGRDSPGVLINADANMYVADLHKGHTLSLSVRDGRQAYLLCVEGNITIKPDSSTCPAGAQDRDEAMTMDRHDAAEMVGPLSYEVQGDAAHLLMIEMVHTPGSGRGDIPSPATCKPC